MDPVITTKEIRKSFRSGKSDVKAVQGVSFEVGRGEVFGFLGPNGAGKTTTARMLTTLLSIDSGQAMVAGFDVVREPKNVRQRIGYVSQLGGADDLATGVENLILQGRLYGGNLVDVRSRARELAYRWPEVRGREPSPEQVAIATRFDTSPPVRGRRKTPDRGAVRNRERPGALRLGSEVAFLAGLTPAFGM